MAISTERTEWINCTSSALMEGGAPPPGNRGLDYLLATYNALDCGVVSDVFWACRGDIHQAEVMLLSMTVEDSPRPRESPVSNVDGDGAGAEEFESALFSSLTSEFPQTDPAIVHALIDATRDTAPHNAPEREDAIRTALLDIVADAPTHPTPDLDPDPDPDLPMSSVRTYGPRSGPSSAPRPRRARQRAGTRMTWGELVSESARGPRGDRWLQQQVPLATQVKVDELRARFPFANAETVRAVLEASEGRSALAEMRLMEMYPVDTPGAVDGFVEVARRPVHGQCVAVSGSAGAGHGNRDNGGDRRGVEFPERPLVQRGRHARVSSYGPFRASEKIEYWLNKARDARLEVERLARVVASTRSTTVAQSVMDSKASAKEYMAEALKEMIADQGFREATSVDLHYLCVEDALEVVVAKVTVTLRYTNYEAVEFVTGRGRNSLSGPRLRPAVVQFAEDHDFRVLTHEDGGAVMIDLRRRA